MSVNNRKEPGCGPILGLLLLITFLGMVVEVVW